MNGKPYLGSTSPAALTQDSTAGEFTKSASSRPHPANKGTPAAQTATSGGWQTAGSPGVVKLLQPGR